MQSDRFGPYQIEAPLSRGAARAVYRAVDTGHDRVVALTLLPEALTADPRYRERFHAQAALAAGLDEPHAVPVRSSGEMDGRLFLEEPLVPGRDLASVLAEDGPMDAARAVAVVDQAARALDAASARGLVRRGLEPSDVLVTGGDGDGEFVHVTGFGVPAAPGAPAGDRAPVPALALLLLACLTGDPAPSGAPAEPPPAGRPEPPAELDEVVHRGLSDDPGEGYATCGEFAAAAQDALRDAAPRPSGTSRLALALGAVVALAVLVALALVLVLGGSDDQADAGSTGDPSTRQPVTVTPSRPPEDPAAEALRATIPLNFTDVECDGGEPTPDGALAVLGCGSARNQPGPEDSVFYLYESPLAADAAFLADMERNGVPPLPAGASCPETQGHGTYRLDGDRGGRVACYIDGDNNAIMIWTQADVATEGVVVIIDGGQFGLDALHVWWSARELSEFVPL